jgi:hypothetical protein
VAKEAERKKAADEVNWSDYFASIVSVCPWSKAYWQKQKIDICEWQEQIYPLGDYVARVYKLPNASAYKLNKLMKQFNEDRPKEEWLYSHPKFGRHSTPIPVLIQQDHQLLTDIRNNIKNK